MEIGKCAVLFKPLIAAGTINGLLGTSARAIQARAAEGQAAGGLQARAAPAPARRQPHQSIAGLAAAPEASASPVHRPPPPLHSPPPTEFPTQPLPTPVQACKNNASMAVPRALQLMRALNGTLQQVPCPHPLVLAADAKDAVLLCLSPGGGLLHGGTAADKAASRRCAQEGVRHA